jgi:hypothetical protein
VFGVSHADSHRSAAAQLRASVGAVFPQMKRMAFHHAARYAQNPQSYAGYARYASKLMRGNTNAPTAYLLVSLDLWW